MKVINMNPEPLKNKVWETRAMFKKNNQYSGEEIFTKEDVKSACEFYLKYKDKPKLLIEEYPELLYITPTIKHLINDLDNLMTEYAVNKNFIGRKMVESLGIARDINRLTKEIDKNLKRLFKLIRREIKIDFSSLDDYNEWLFKLAFKDVLGDENGK